MRRASTFAVSVAVALAFVACERRATRDAEADIRAMTREYEAAIAAGNYDLYLSFFTDDAVVMPPNSAILRGKQAFGAWARPAFQNFNVRETVEYYDILVFGDTAVATHGYTLSLAPKAGGTAQVDRGKGIVVLRRGADGAWRWSHVIWNSSAPVPAPPPTPSN